MDELRARNADAWLAALAPVEMDLFRFLRKLARNEAEAEDLLQETVRQAMRRSERLHSVAAFKPWMFAIAYRTWRHDRRMSKRGPVTLDEAALDAAGAFDDDARADPAEWLVAREEEALLLRELNNLPEEQRAALHLYYYQGLTLQECAEILESPLTTTWKLLEAARLTLKLKLS